MTSGVALWLRIASCTAVALGLLFAVAPARPRSQLPWLAQPVVGACAGALLYMFAARRRPHLPSSAASFPVLAAKQGFFGLWAMNEEIVWRRVVLGELLPAGVPAAIAASTLGFALAHRTRRSLHLGTGAAFGGLYLGTGALTASIAAHWIYNTLVDGFVERSRNAGEAMP